MTTYNKYIVLNRDIVRKNLTQTEYNILYTLLGKINQECVNTGTSMSEYLVCKLNKVNIDNLKDDPAFKNGLELGTRI